MTTYAQLNEQGECFAWLQFDGEWEAPNVLPIPDGEGMAYIGRTFTDGAWKEKQEPPRIVITAIDAGEHTAQSRIAADFSEVDTSVGAVLNITAELRSADGAVLPLSETFRMPVASTDGREKVVLANMVDGIITIRIPMTESRTWRVTQETINRTLPPAMQMAFAGLTVYVIEA